MVSFLYKAYKDQIPSENKEKGPYNGDEGQISSKK